jgi:ComF family protein
MPTLSQTLLHFFHSGITALLPTSCALCGETGNTLICTGCRQQFISTSTARCIQCAVSLPAPLLHHRCGACLSSQPYFDHTIVAVDYTAPFDQLVLALKFGHQLPLSRLFSELLRDAILQDKQQQLPDILCPVPLGMHRLAERGFNQSLEIARPLSVTLGVALQPQLLHRSRETAQQSSLHPDQRHKNVRNAFMINPRAIELIKGKHIALVDDVMTTGTTLNEIGGLLKRFGAAKVSNFVFARTPLH